MRVVLQGDTHGDTIAVEHALLTAARQQAEVVIILGDYCYMWPGRREVEGSGCRFTNKVSRIAEQHGVDVWWFEGNHDNMDELEARGYFEAEEPVEVAPRVWYISRGTLLPVGDSRVLFIGGAHSVDKPYRTAHLDWWPQEELTTAQVERCLEAEDVDVVLSHDTCNTGFRAALSLAADGKEDLNHLAWKNDQQFPGARANRMALEAIWRYHQPARWWHGHYHSSFRVRSGPTEFVGLAHQLHDGALDVVDL